MPDDRCVNPHPDSILEKQMKIKELIIAATDNKDALSKVEDCTCYYCAKSFKVAEIVEWCDNGLTALCPVCKVDSIVPGNDYDEDFLVEANNYWFE